MIGFRMIPQGTTGTRLAATLPILPIAAVYTLVGLVRLSIGRWPVYGNPDPATLPQPLLAVDIAVTLAYISLFPSFLLAAIVLPFTFFRSLRWLRNPLLAWIVSAGLAIWMSSLDIGGAFSWLMD
ncbi:MAG TPA: hypothetical protein VK886_03015 [Vicinamibacterales bacterium]|nr:hypothetical protein [Vicinamibacterales bacterium]